MASENNDRSVWSDTEVHVLLSIWGDKAILDKMDGTCRNSEVYKTIVTKMAECGYQRSVSQIKYKIKNLKRDYRKFVDHNNRSGMDRRTFKFSEELGLILGDRPSSNPVSVTEVGCGDSVMNRSDVQDSVEFEETDSDDDSQNSQDSQSTEDDGRETEEDDILQPSLSGSVAGTSGAPPRQQKRAAESGSVGSIHKKGKGRKGPVDELIAYQAKADEAYLREERRREREQRELEEKWRRESLDSERRMMDVMTTFMTTITDMARRSMQSPQRPNVVTQQQPPQQPLQQQPGSSLHQPWQHPHPSWRWTSETGRWTSETGQTNNPQHGVDPRFLPK